MVRFRRSLIQLEYSGGFLRLHRKRIGDSPFALPPFYGSETGVGIHQYSSGKVTFQLSTPSVFFSRLNMGILAHNFPHSVHFNIHLTAVSFLPWIDSRPAVLSSKRSL